MFKYSYDTFCACVNLLSQVETSPFVERLLRKGYEVLYLTEPVDEYCMEALPEYEGILASLVYSIHIHVLTSMYALLTRSKKIHTSLSSY